MAKILDFYIKFLIKSYRRSIRMGILNIRGCVNDKFYHEKNYKKHNKKERKTIQRKIFDGNFNQERKGRVVVISAKTNEG
jgi:hypothetical protein